MCIRDRFISMRTPSEAREDVRHVMESVGLDYYDRFEWLLRSEIKCGDDNLLVVKKPAQPQKIRGFENINDYRLTPDDILSIDSLSDFESTNAKVLYKAFLVYTSNCDILTPFKLNFYNLFLISSAINIKLYQILFSLISSNVHNGPDVYKRQLENSASVIFATLEVTRLHLLIICNNIPLSLTPHII